MDYIQNSQDTEDYITYLTAVWDSGFDPTSVDGQIIFYDIFICGTYIHSSIQNFD
jgi:hypothetical protein